jgi:type IV pilus assembly protein PilA
MASPPDYAPPSQQQPQMAYPPPPRPAGGGGSGATVLVIVLGVVFVGIVLVGILAVLAIYGVRKYIANAKTAEARNSLGEIAKDGAAAYEAERPDGTRRLCPSASSPIPARIGSVRGMKYMSTPTEWSADEKRNAGFYCLKFSMSTPQYFMYGYKAHGTSSPGDGFVGTANGDLNGDGVASTFEITADVGAGGDLHVAPMIRETDPEE